VPLTCGFTLGGTVTLSVTTSVTGKSRHRPRAGRPSKYPWNVWLDGNEKVIDPRVDIEGYVHIESLRVQVLNEATRRGIVVRTSVLNGKLGLFFDPDASWIKAEKWDKLFDGTHRVLKTGVDYRWKSSAFIKIVEREAGRRGIEVMLTLPMSGHVGVQAVDLPNGRDRCR
jgi:hypothetical protein